MMKKYWVLLGGVAFCLLVIAYFQPARALALHQTNKAKGFILQKHLAVFRPNAFSDFRKWILSKKPQAAKKELLELTVLKAHYPLSHSLAWYKADMTHRQFSKVLSLPLSAHSFFIVKTERGFYSYHPNGEFWIDFANPAKFGGGFRSNGNVQEERMFMEFPQLAQLAYVSRHTKKLLPVNRRNEPEPFLIANVKRLFDISEVPYGHSLDKTSPHQIEKEVRALHPPYAQAHIIGMAAKDWSKVQHKEYSMTDLRYYLKAALLGDLAAYEYQVRSGYGAPVIHSGPLGAGAFRNSVHMMTAIQILAAAMAQREYSHAHGTFILHGINPSIVGQIYQEVLHKMEKGETPYAILKAFYERQKTDPSWKPR